MNRAERRRQVLDTAWQLLQSDLGVGLAYNMTAEEAEAKGRCAWDQAAMAFEREMDRLIEELRRRSERPLPPARPRRKVKE